MAYLNETGLQTLWTKIKNKATEIAGTVVSTHNDSVSAHTDIRTAVSAKYDKPSGGIPSSDMTVAVQTSLGKADSAIQTHQDISGKVNYTDKLSQITGAMDATEKTSVRNAIGAGTGNGTITGITMNGSSKGTSGTVDLGTVVTSTSDCVKLTGNQSISGAKTFTNEISVNGQGTIGADSSEMWFGNTTRGYLLVDSNGLEYRDSDQDDYKILTMKVKDTTPTSGSTNWCTSGGIYTAVSAKEATANKITTITGSSTDTQYPSALAVKNYVDSAITGGSAYQGTLANESALTSLANYKSGWYWFASSAWDSASLGIHIDRGNMIIAKTAAASYTAANFNVIQSDIEAIPDSVINALD